MSDAVSEDQNQPKAGGLNQNEGGDVASKVSAGGNLSNENCFGEVSIDKLELLKKFDDLAINAVGNIIFDQFFRPRIEKLQSHNVDDEDGIISEILRLVSKIGALSYLIDSQINPGKRPLYDYLKVNPMPYGHQNELERSDCLESFEIAAYSRFIGRNWYEMEGNEFRCWRWSGPERISSILVSNLCGGKLRLTLEISQAKWIDPRRDVKFFFGKEPLKFSPSENGATWTAEMIAEETGSEMMVPFIIEANEMHSPLSQGTGPDKRKIAIAFRRLVIRKA